MKGKITICLAVLISMCSPAVLCAGKQKSRGRALRDCLCSIHEVTLPEYYNNPQRNHPQDAGPTIQLIESLTWLKVVPHRDDGIAQLSFGTWESSTRAESDALGASVGNSIEFSLHLVDASKGVNWLASTRDFEGTRAVPGPNDSVRTVDVSADDLAAEIRLLRKLNKAAHGCK
jgi:hypothetical protein